MRCPSCGNLNREGARFCDSCGAELSPSGADAPQDGAAAERQPPPDAPQRIAERYELRRFLGRGGRKDVYLAHDERTERQVAVALFDTKGLGEAALTRARREVQATEKLGEHPHLVTVFETGELDGRPYIVSSYMAGGDVERLLAASDGGRLPTERAIDIACDVCRGLEHAHARGVVHRDLKPANVWLAEDGSARLGDFGLALAGGSRGVAPGMLVGTVAYLPPEQAIGRPSGPRSDLYSLGAMLYQMVCGQPPFLGDDAVAIIGQHLNAEPVAPSRHNHDVPEELDRLIGELLAKSAQQRPESAAAVRERLMAIKSAPRRAAEPEAEDPLKGLAGGVFVGREDELAELRSAADSALSGRGRLALLSGEPGIGKTATAEELATYARVRGAKVHWGRCQEGEGAPAYWPWVQLIRSYAREADPVALAWELGAGGPDIARIVPELAERAGIDAAGGERDDEQARFRLFDSISAFFSNASASRPLVLVLDDLHWADEPTLLLLQFIARELGNSSLLLIGTYRDIELGRHHPLARVLGELSARGANRLALHGLTRKDVRRYMQITAGAEPPVELIEAVHAHTEGNPFFVSEVVRLLASEGRLADGRGAELAIPQGVRDVIGRRLDRLSPQANEALRVAAAIGRDFDVEVLGAAAGIEPGPLGEALAQAVSAQLLRPASEGRFRFAHALVRETLYAELSAAQRPALHLRIAEALERSYESDPSRLDRRLAELARHFLEAAPAGDPEKAVDYATRAARRAEAQLGYEEAAEHYGRALEVLGLCSPDEERRCRLLLSLGEAQTKAGKFVEARETLEKAASVAQQVESPELLSRAALGVAYVCEVGALDEAVVRLLSAALETVGEEDSPTRAALLLWLGQQHYWVDPQGRSVELRDQAAAMARRVGDQRTLAQALYGAAFVASGPEAAREGLKVGAEIADLARGLGDREMELRAHVLLLRDHLQLGEVPAVDRELEHYARLASELRQPQHLWHVPLLRGTRAMIDGRFDDAERLAGEAREGGERAGEPLAQQFFAIQAALLYRLQGRLEEILDALGGLAARYPAIPAWRIARALVLSDLGRTDQARGEFEGIAADGFAAISVDAQWVTAVAMCCEIAFALGDAARATALHEMLAPWSGQVVVPGRAAGSWGPVARYLGLASAAMEQSARAVSELSEALELSERMGDRPFVAQAQLNLAQVLMSRDGTGDRERAFELLDACLDASHELGMRAISERALALKLEAQGLVGVDVTSSIDDVVTALESERPDIRAHAAPDGTVTILFSDIENSTTMTERLGDERWLDLLRSHNAVFREALREHDGYEVKNQGDGFMLVFPRPSGALRCAMEVQRAFADHEDRSADERIRVRMGLHTGEAIAAEGDFFGRNVILAARIAARATGGEILVSEALYRQATDEDGLSFDKGREVELKGLAGTHTVYRADWQAQPSAA